MLHARSDYNRIQDRDGLIPEDEPVFLLRAQDLLAPALVNEWAMRARVNGVDEAMVEAAFQQAVRMMSWQEKHRRKLPDMPPGSGLPEREISRGKYDRGLG